ncbi:MAG: hypothetical protein IKV77_10310 [Alistipes sp.]|nr:hypothetical protein [Alistipes sp.]
MRIFKRYILFAVAAMVLLFSCNRANPTHTKIRQSVERQLELYPESTLRDLYKNFFQDRFGPGHIIADDTVANRYLRYELNAAEGFEGLDYEPTGYEGRFYRVNLGVIADGRVPYEKYFDAFVRSVNNIKPISIEQWRTEWHEIDSVIMSMGLQLENFSSDRAEIKALIDGGDYVMHHSQRFNDHYQPHYRIIERTIFENEILPLLSK